MHEFELIEHFFSTGTADREEVILGIGDDAALLRVPSDQKVVTAIATIRDPMRKESPESLGHRALDLSLGRLMDFGATPVWATLALTMPNVDRDWLRRFTHSIKDLARRSHVCLVGGDTTQGPLAITIVSNGYIPISD
uniref:Thiamine-monophosphate kinase n=1 Tax=Candidatus Kentrum sp. FW TaxID=2126338 RepID=A0A450TMJ6_9GAMM|nr:MAG: thiamine-monophosphate kinase [Candidatus Kentron sp. FW]VFJ68943.1 MAG: thiamine-monophosphate kinase [Candidatus Kentron sp. FW]